MDPTAIYSPMFTHHVWFGLLLLSRIFTKMVQVQYLVIIVDLSQYELLFIFSGDDIQVIIRTHDGPKNHVFPCVYTTYLVLITVLSRHTAKNNP